MKKLRYEWFHNNHNKGDAEKLNQLAKTGNIIMNCAFYHYKEGPAPQAKLRSEGVTATYRAWLGTCQHCGHKYNEHYEPRAGQQNLFMPCGYPINKNYTGGAIRLNRNEVVMPIS